MSDQFVFVAEGLKDLRDIDNLDIRIVDAARKAVNKTLKFARADAARAIRQQVNLPARYLSGANGRLTITQYAQGRHLEGVVTGRHRATSLARFAKGTPQSTRRRGGVSLEVKPGSPKFMERAFLIRLRAGKSGLDTKSNLGLAIRLRPGETIRNKNVQLVKWKGLALLYGPSVDQVFDDVAQEDGPTYVEKLEDEFNRLLRLT